MVSIRTPRRSPQGCFKGPSRGTPTLRLRVYSRGTQGVLWDDTRRTQWALRSACHQRLRYSMGDHRRLTGYSQGTFEDAPICRPLTPPTDAPVGFGTLVMAAPTETGTTVASSSNTKAIAGGIGGAVAFVLVVVGAVILRKTCRKLKQKDAAKPDASAHELQRKDRPDALKLGAGASRGTNAPPSQRVAAAPCVQVGRSLLRPRPLLRFRPGSMQRWRWPRPSARYARWPLGGTRTVVRED